MSNSLEFCKKRASNPDVSTYSDRDWNNISGTSKIFENNITQLLDMSLKGLKEYEVTGHLKGKEVFYNVKLTIDPDSDFDYFTSDSFLSDGTLLFLLESMNKLLRKVLCLNSINKQLGEPSSGCTVNLTIGNFVILNEYDGDWVSKLPENKKFMRERTTVLLPLRMSYE